MHSDRSRHGEFSPKRKPCKLCQERVGDKANLPSSVQIDYKDTFKLRRYLSEQGKILGRRVTGNCSEHQKSITLAVKRAREIGLVSVGLEQ